MNIFYKAIAYWLWLFYIKVEVSHLVEYHAFVALQTSLLIENGLSLDMYICPQPSDINNIMLENPSSIYSISRMQCKEGRGTQRPRPTFSELIIRTLFDVTMIILVF